MEIIENLSSLGFITAEATTGLAASAGFSKVTSANTGSGKGLIIFKPRMYLISFFGKSSVRPARLLLKYSLVTGSGGRLAAKLGVEKKRKTKRKKAFLKIRAEQNLFDRI